MWTVGTVGLGWVDGVVGWFLWLLGTWGYICLKLAETRDVPTRIPYFYRFFIVLTWDSTSSVGSAPAEPWGI